MEGNNLVHSYTLESDGTSLRSSDIDTILEFLKTELDNTDEVDFTLIKEKKYTQKEIDDLPDFEGF